AVGEDVLPAFPDGPGAEGAQAARVDAGHVFVIAPYAHHQGDVALAHGFVEGVFRFFGRREHGGGSGSVAVHLFAFAQGVAGAAVLAARHLVLDDLDVDARVLAPEGCLGAGAIDRQVFGADFDDVLVAGGFGHAAHGVS